MTTLPYRELLSGDAPHKPLMKKKKRQGGRNAFGRITTRHQGGGHKRRLRDIDFSYNKKNVPAKIETVEYDPFRSAFIGLALYQDGERRYVILPKEMKVNSSFIVGEDVPLATGNRMPLGKIPVGAFIYNIELSPGAGSVLVRSAGNFAEVVAHDAGYAQVKLPPPRFVKSPTSATLLSARSATKNIISSSSAKPGGLAGWVYVRRFAAPL